MSEILLVLHSFSADITQFNVLNPLCFSIRQYFLTILTILTLLYLLAYFIVPTTTNTHIAIINE